MVHGVQAVGGGVAGHILGIMHGDPGLEDVSVAVAVGVGHAAPDQVAHGVGCLASQTGGQLAGGAVDDLHLNIGVFLIEAGDQSIQVGVGHGGVEDQVAGQLNGLLGAGAGTSAGAGSGAGGGGSAALVVIAGATGNQRQGHGRGQGKGK